MKTLKDKKKFGWKSNKSKNRKCKKFGYSFDKYNRKYWRTEIKRIRHKLLNIYQLVREKFQIYGIIHILILKNYLELFIIGQILTILMNGLNKFLIK